jgi:hypothetical protein
MSKREAGGDRVVERGWKGIFGSKQVIDRQHSGACRRQVFFGSLASAHGDPAFPVGGVAV